MNGLAKLSHSLLKNNSLLNLTVRNAGAWNKDWKPGPYPKTQEERDAAAKKYGLHPNDYQPYPDDGTGSGDYPMFDPVAVEARDPFEHYDIPVFRRNYGEVIHRDADIYTGERYNINKKFPISRARMAVIYLSVVGTFYLLYEWSNQHKFIVPVMNPQIPTDGKKYYTFEPVD